MASSLCCMKPHFWRRSSAKDRPSLRPPLPLPSPSRSLTSRRNYSIRKTCRVSSSSPLLRGSSLRCNCLGSLVDPDGVMASDLVTVSDQLLLMVSIFLTYIAGVSPRPKSSLAPGKNLLEDNVVADSSASPGSAKKNYDDVNFKYSWDAVKEKLLDSLDAMENKRGLGNKILDFEEQRAKRPLSLYAVSEGPSLRLLWASLQRLEKEVNGILGDCEPINTVDWLRMFPEIIRKSYHHVCMAWLVEEINLGNKEFDKELGSLMIDKLKGDDSVLQNIRKSGKEDLYAELLYFLRFGSVRKSCCYDSSLFMLHGDSILEDLVITLADGVASAYLELISVDGSLSDELSTLGMVMCNLSTRALQRLRNEVALNQWLYQNVEAVVSMYEDRFDLWTLQLREIKEPSLDQAENYGWWKKLTLQKSRKISSSFCYIVISQFSMPVKRTKELRALTGWRYYFSLYLELSDICMPIIITIIDRVSNAITFFLVSLIGRSLGLIYTGIRQSLRWK